MQSKHRTLGSSAPCDRWVYTRGAAYDALRGVFPPKCPDPVVPSPVSCLLGPPGAIVLSPERGAAEDVHPGTCVNPQAAPRGSGTTSRPGRCWCGNPRPCWWRETRTEVLLECFCSLDQRGKQSSFWWLLKDSVFLCINGIFCCCCFDVWKALLVWRGKAGEEPGDVCGALSLSTGCWTASCFYGTLCVKWDLMEQVYSSKVSFSLISVSFLLFPMDLLWELLFLPHALGALSSSGDLCTVGKKKKKKKGISFQNVLDRQGHRQHVSYRAGTPRSLSQMERGLLTKTSFLRLLPMEVVMES